MWVSINEQDSRKDLPVPNVDVPNVHSRLWRRSMVRHVGMSLARNQGSRTKMRHKNDSCPLYQGKKERSLLFRGFAELMR